MKQSFTSVFLIDNIYVYVLFRYKLNKKSENWKNKQLFTRLKNKLYIISENMFKWDLYAMLGVQFYNVTFMIIIYQCIFVTMLFV